MSNRKLWTLIVIGTLTAGFLIGFIGNKLKSNIKETSSDSELNIQSTTEIQSYLQGKWHLAYYPSGGLTIHLRLLIEGNTMKVWSSVNDHNNENDYTWNMSEPPSEVYNFKIGNLTAKDSKRYLEWDDYGDLTMQQRAIGNFFVANSGFHHGASAYVVERGWSE